MVTTSPQDGLNGDDLGPVYLLGPPNQRTDLLGHITTHRAKALALHSKIKDFVARLEIIANWADRASYNGLKALQDILDTPIPFTDITEVPEPPNFEQFIDRVHEVELTVVRRILRHECMYRYLKPVFEIKKSVKKAVAVLHYATLPTGDGNVEADKLAELSLKDLWSFHEKVYLWRASMLRATNLCENEILAILNERHDAIDPLRKERDALSLEDRHEWEASSGRKRDEKMMAMVREMLDGGKANRTANLEIEVYTSRWKRFRTLGMYYPIGGLLRQWDEVDKVWQELKLAVGSS
ncbi:hypothetical protein HBH70_151600 [Parastagonospora nodorum]|nr:hypothetical protein HBH53_167330 [Parastagonospora nodorum]KAH3965437.1 hypothetical protein HBH51_150910 [Parastagonospora nodorum]KAH3999964.1 hypothetical protein HBI10_110570 [Parastagonospora nodorum]KAH4022136.1 hypothetical protein HBI13_098640 [Parastagonospora nodorum]KAH4027863.1 hypothetical protein HBI09_144210 [Parastagonospora nodorum]